MNQQKKAVALLAIILIPVVSLAVVYSYSMNLGGSGDVGTPCFNVTVIVEYGRDFGHGVNQTFAGLNFPQGATAFEVLLNVTSVEYQYTGSLVLVTAINGVHNNASANLFWQYYVNGVFGPVASNLCYLGNNSVVEWIYTPSQF